MALTGLRYKTKWILELLPDSVEKIWQNFPGNRSTGGNRTEKWNSRPTSSKFLSADLISRSFLVRGHLSFLRRSKCPNVTWNDASYFLWRTKSCSSGSALCPACHVLDWEEFRAGIRTHLLLLNDQYWHGRTRPNHCTCDTFKLSSFKLKALKTSSVLQPPIFSSDIYFFTRIQTHLQLSTEADVTCSLATKSIHFLTLK